MALKVEGVVNGGMHAEKALCGASRFEALHFPLPPSHDLVRVLGAIAHPQPLLVTAGQMELPERGGIGAQLVGDRQLGRKALLLSSLRISLTAARLSRRGWISRSRISPS
jgi:hypothetical protein